MTDGGIATDTPVDPFALWRELQEPNGPPADRTSTVDLSAADLSAADVDSLAELDDPRLVLTDGYVGRDRRRRGTGATLARTTFAPRRKLLRLDVLVVLSVVIMVLGALLLVDAGHQTGRTAPRAAVAALAPTDATQARPHTPTTVPPTTLPLPTAAGTPTPATTAAPPAAPAVSAAPAASAPATTATTAPAPVVAPPAATPGTPDAMGAAALALVRYPWQQLPDYSIKFLPITDAPSPGFYGNTVFTWGQVGGTSTLYVYPGETVDQLAGIIGFEIGHEVDAGYVEPQGGHEQIAALLGIQPASWAPECDCAEQGYLSGWYAAAFSNYWTPGVGQWSTLAQEPSGALLTAMEPWLDPRIP